MESNDWYGVATNYRDGWMLVEYTDGQHWNDMAKTRQGPIGEFLVQIEGEAKAKKMLTELAATLPEKEFRLVHPLTAEIVYRYIGVR